MEAQDGRLSTRLCDQLFNLSSSLQVIDSCVNGVVAADNLKKAAWNFGFGSPRVREKVS